MTLLETEIAEPTLTLSFRGSKSRNKVSVGEPAEGSFAKNFRVHLFVTVDRKGHGPSVRGSGCRTWLTSVIKISNKYKVYNFQQWISRLLLR